MKNLFVSNRERTMEALGGGIIVLSAYTKMQRSNDEAFKFEQEANFWWCTGIEAPDWRVIIDGNRGKCWLVAPEISDIHRLFDGSLSSKDAIKVSGIDSVISQEEEVALLRDLAKKHSIVYALGDHPHIDFFDFVINPAQRKLYEQLDRIFNSVQDCRKDFAKLRAIKQPEEITRLKKSIKLTTDAFEQAKARLQDYTYEYDIEADFSSYFRRHGAKGHAFDPIVASGKNACQIHYIDNDAKLKSRQLVLLDIGARHYGYSADVARTYAYGEPTKRQQAVHKAVQEAQQQIIRLLKPDLGVEEYQQQVDRIMIEALMGLDLMKDAADIDTYRKYFPYAIGHGLGIDTHDSLGAPRFLQPGMVLTVEPGIHIPEEGIGVRIEDDILITASGHTNLSGRLSTDL